MIAIQDVYRAALHLHEGDRQGDNGRLHRRRLDLQQWVGTDDAAVVRLECESHPAGLDYRVVGDGGACP